MSAENGPEAGPDLQWAVVVLNYYKRYEDEMTNKNK